MSYVIQNFYNLPRLIVITPKLKFLMILNSLDCIYVFLKSNNYLFIHHTSADSPFGFLVLLFRVFFIKNINNIFNKLNHKLTSKYPNEVAKGAIYWSYRSLQLFLSKNYTILGYLYFKNYLFFNLYFLSIKVINIKLHKTFYKNIFFYLMLFIPSIWYAHHEFMRFYLNFFFIKYNLQICKFYNGHFLRVYNF
jgi:hypothetical protein